MILLSSGISLPSSVVGNADRMSASAASNVVTTTMSDAPTAAVSQPVASGEISDPGLANIKEKTPMCLVNELARFNKITHQVRYYISDLMVIQLSIVHFSIIHQSFFSQSFIAQLIDLSIIHLYDHSSLIIHLYDHSSL